MPTQAKVATTPHNKQISVTPEERAKVLVSDNAGVHRLSAIFVLSWHPENDNMDSRCRGNVRECGLPLSRARLPGRKRIHAMEREQPRNPD